MGDHSERGILGLIPARGNSKGIARKNLRRLAGQPLVLYACQAAWCSRRLTRTIVSTDSPEIAELARAAGVEVPFLRPAHLATDRARSVDVVRHALDWLAQHQQWRPAIVVLLQPTAPLREARHIDQALELLEQGDADAVVSVVSVPRHFHPRWQMVVRQGRLATFTGAPLTALPSRRQDLAPTYARNGAIYAIRVAALEATGSLLGSSCQAYFMPPEVSIDIDTREDWQLAERTLMARRREPGHAA